MDAQSDLAHRDACTGMPDGDGGVFLHLHRDPSNPCCGSLDLCGVTPEVLSRLHLLEPTPDEWQAWFSVFVGSANQVGQEALPAVLGQYSVVGDCVRFKPKYAFMTGLTYQARINLAHLAVGHEPLPVVWLPFSAPRGSTAATTVVESIFPSGDLLPENALRFYIHFSAPMQSGSSHAHIALVGPDGRSIDGAFLDLATELWDADMRRLTMILHPGRIKRGVGANIEVGPALVAGKCYSIVVDDGMADGAGRSLRQTFQKAFIAAPAVRRLIDPQQWALRLPLPGTRQPLVLSFPDILDHALLSNSLRVVDANQQRVVGTIVVDALETQWTFSPKLTWQSGLYQVLIDQRLEDICGNTIAAPFDIDGHAGRSRARSPHPYSLPFHLTDVGMTL